LDHKNLNLDVDYFKKVVPTAENICIFIWDILRLKLDSKNDLEVTLFETPRNFVKYSGK
jgi:6-pyruvoyltetrahydropterin/6-carboxytetrahydropterin synthase